MSKLEELAARYDALDLPWEELDRAGTGLLESDAYIDVMRERFDEYFKMMFTLDIPEITYKQQLALDQARDAYKVVKDATVLVAPVAVEAIALAVPTLSAKEAMHVRAIALRRMIVVANAVAASSLAAHETGVVRWMVERGEMTLEEAMKDASDTYAIWGALLELDRLGLLNVYKKPQFGTSGLGEITTATVVLVIAIVAGIAIVAWLVITLVEGSRRAEFMDKSCFDADGRLLADRPPFCDRYGDELAKNPNAHLASAMEPFTLAAGTLSKGLAAAAILGVVLYVGGVYVMPAMFAETGRRSLARAG